MGIGVELYTYQSTREQMATASILFAYKYMDDYGCEESLLSQIDLKLGLKRKTPSFLDDSASGLGLR